MTESKVNELSNLEFLLNEELIQVCIGLFQVILRFTNELEITLENTYYIEMGEGITELSATNPSHSKHLVDLIGQSIKLAQNLENQEVDITFSDGCILKLLANKSGTESYSITGGKNEIFF